MTKDVFLKLNHCREDQGDLSGIPEEDADGPTGKVSMLHISVKHTDSCRLVELKTGSNRASGQSGGLPAHRMALELHLFSKISGSLPSSAQGLGNLHMFLSICRFLYYLPDFSL